MEFRILGSLEVEHQGELLKLGSAKQRAVLALLLLHANDVVPRERLIDELWGGEPPETARTAVQVYVSQLRKALGRDVIVTKAPGYLIRVEREELDFDRFESLVDEARGEDAAVAAKLLRDALRLWRGPALEELDPVARSDRARLEEQRLSVLEQRIDADLALGRHAELVPELEGLVRSHPLRDKFRGQLMLALYRSGRQADALEVYRSARRQLDEELGLEPGEDLKRLERAILEQDPSLAAVAVEREESSVAAMPSGTVTFLFTDIEGSTRLERELRDRYGEVLREHQRLLRAAFAGRGGHEVDTQGDSFFFVFPRARAAVEAAVDAQRALARHVWPEGGQIRVRIGISTGEAALEGGRYTGFAVHRAARIAAAGHGGQILLSSSTRDVVEHDLDAGLTVRDLGNRRFKDLPRPERVYQLVAEGLPSEFAPLKTLDVELRRKRRRRMYAGAGLIGVLAAVAIPVFALSQGSGGGGANVPPNSLAIVDAETNDVLGSVPVGIRPGPVAVGEDAVWVGNLDDRTLSKVDPAARTVQRNIPLDYMPTGVTTAAGAVWIANGILGTVSRLDPSVDAVGDPIEVTGRSTEGSVAFGEGKVWAAFGIGELGRINPTTSVVEAKGVAGVTPSAVAVGEGSVWVANAGENNVSRINPRIVTEVDEPSTGRRPSGIAVGAGSIWVTNEADDSVTRIDAASGSTETIFVGKGPIGIAFGADAVWVANAGDGTVSRIDPETRDVVKTISVGGSPTGVAVGDGVVWVTVQAPLEE